MKIHTLPDSPYIFSGAPELVLSAKIYVNLANSNAIIDLAHLKPITEINHDYVSLNPDVISKALGFKTINFDGIKIYTGRKKGLNLSYIKLPQSDATTSLHVVFLSSGEYQPGRFMCYIEGYA